MIKYLGFSWQPQLFHCKCNPYSGSKIMFKFMIGLKLTKVSTFFRTRHIQKNPIRNGWGFQKKGDDILSHNTAVPSAQAGLTSLFGMGRGEPRRNNHLKVVSN